MNLETRVQRLEGGSDGGSYCPHREVIVWCEADGPVTCSVCGLPPIHGIVQIVYQDVDGSVRPVGRDWWRS